MITTKYTVGDILNLVRGCRESAQLMFDEETGELSIHKPSERVTLMHNDCHILNLSLDRETAMVQVSERKAAERNVLYKLEYTRDGETLAVVSSFLLNEFIRKASYVYRSHKITNGA
jgi:hypothetical protein